MAGSLPAGRTPHSTPVSASRKSMPLCVRSSRSRPEDSSANGKLTPPESGQNGFGDVAFIGWVPLDLYRASGAKMRSRKEVHRHWPVPQQPEQDELIGLEEEHAVRILPYEEEVSGEEQQPAELARPRKDRFRIQW